MSLTKKDLRKIIIGLVLVAMLISACTRNNPTEEVTATLALTSTPSEPTPTPVPAAAIVNGESVPLAWYESELQRYLVAQEAAGTPVTDQAAAGETVLNGLINQYLLAQGAQEAGFSVTDQEVQARIDALAEKVDLAAWMAQWGYSDTDLFNMLKLEILAALERDQIAATIPETMEQVEIRQVFAYTAAGAQSARTSLASGSDFEDVAYTYDPTTGGYLGWVPRGYLLIPAVEEVAFSLPVGSYSDIIESEVGYHIVMVLDRGEHALSSDARLTLQRNAVAAWLADKLATSLIDVVVN
ncbi:SurA N-terminal domain-containing protein [Chloroflexota bacterium]|nr:SurA N-terminal domain-containing protein [Chloroflexota bacterium]